MSISPPNILTDDDLRQVLRRVDELWEAEPDTPDFSELCALVALIDSYEEKHLPVGPPEPPEPPHKGAGVFVRVNSQVTEYALDELDWLCICVLGKGQARNRTEWLWRQARARGIGLSAWDWFPRPDNPTKGLNAAMRFAAEQGATSFVLNAEKGFLGRKETAKVYASTARELADDLGLDLGFTSYAEPSTVKLFPWEVFADHCDFGIPQIYDRENKFDPTYPRRSIQDWSRAGFRAVVPGCGIYWGREKADGDGWSWYWRDEEMVRRHLALFPSDMDAWVAWPLSGSLPEGSIRGLVWK